MTYFESRIPVNINDFNEIKKKIDICENLGIKNIILEPMNGIEIIQSDFRKRVQKESKVNIFFRINLNIKCFLKIIFFILLNIQNVNSLKIRAFNIKKRDF